ncbi:Manganese-dependent ADP-ribose/CDP-alcohol diphosphatase [Diplonema papillatum]|nr:Manganese-dependent ADP-ribose/CDP-alcohol diphosphatase [Diplonema papillatum]
MRLASRCVKSAPRPAAAPDRGDEPALARFGLISDVQYADLGDAYNFGKTGIRRYRSALRALRHAVDSWTDPETPPVSFVASLGDLIDQQNEALGQSREALRAVLSEFGKVAEVCPVWHLFGNHELYNFTQDEVTRLVPGILGDTGEAYHSFTPVPGWRVVILNSYDIHCIVDKEEPACAEGAFRWLERHNANDVRAKRGTVNWGAGLAHGKAHYVPFNGGIGEGQLRWLAGVMRETVERGEKAVVLCHVPLLPGSTQPATLAWNYGQVLSVLEEGNVVAVFAGHDHCGGHAVSGKGTHHITMPSPLSTDQDRATAHAIVELYEDCIRINGSGLVPSRVLEINPAMLSHI